MVWPRSAGRIVIYNKRRQNTDKKRDPAYEIIQDAIKEKDRWKKQFNSSTSEVYIKAKEVISEKEKKRRKKLKEQEKIEKENKKNGLRIYMHERDIYWEKIIF